jgi:inositol oxygenase
VKEKFDLYCKNFNKVKMSLWSAIYKLNEIVDDSDPDLNLSQSDHAFQVAEGVRKAFPDDEELHLVGLLHDIGKVLLLPEFGNLPQWSVVGDTYPVGCAYSDKIVYSEYFELNKDYSNSHYNSKLGIYKQNCGLENVIFSFSHDIYAYELFKHNNCLISDDYLKIIKYHSAYVIHKDNEYQYLMNDNDYKIVELCKLFSKCDLYTKDNSNKLNTEELFPYYDKLIDKYFPNKILEW